VIEGIGDNTSLALVSFDTDHGMCLTTSSLSVSKDGSVITIHDGFDQWKSTFIIDSPLVGVFVINSIVSETSAGVS